MNVSKMDDRGQATVAVLIILPVVLALFVGAVIFINIFSLEAKATAACRVSMVESQKKAAEALTELLALNGAALALEKSRQAAKFAVAASLVSGNPIAIGSARAALAAAELAQAPMIAKQTAALTKGKRASWSASPLAREAIRSALPFASEKSSSIQAKFGTVLSSSSKMAHFDVIASPPGARTPTYRTAPGFQRSQEARARWLLSLPSPKIEISESREPTRSIEIGCAVTLDNTGGGLWRPKMTEDRLLRN